MRTTPYTTYVIQNSLGVVYVGISTNFKRRLKQHRSGVSPSTNKGCLDWIPHHLWQMPSYLYMSKLERLLHKMKCPRAVKAYAEMHPTFDGQMRADLDSIPTTKCDEQFIRPVVRNESTIPKRPKLNRGTPKAQRIAKKVKKAYHNGVKKQRADRAVLQKEEFALFKLDPETIRKLNHLEKPDYPR